MSSPLLEIRGLVKDYQALRPLRVRDFSVAPAAAITLLGLDAPAAEAFVHLVTGAALPDQGEITLFGTNTRGITDATAWLHTLDRLGLVSHRAVLVEVLSVTERGPAARAGIRVGDWILGLDGKPIPSIDALLRLLGPDHVGRPATLALLRGREPLTLVVDPETDGS